MTAFGPRANGGRDDIGEARRRLLAAAYPDRDPAWIAEQAALAEHRVDTAQPPPEPEPPPAASGGKVVRWVVGIAVLGVAVFLGITQREWIAQTALDRGGVVSLIAATAVVLGATAVDQVRIGRRKLLSCRVRIDTSYGIDVGEKITLRRPDKTTLKNAGFVVARIKNMGRTPIEPVDYLSPLTISFPGRTVVNVDATESDPPDLAERIAEDPGFGEGVLPDRIRLPKIPLQPGDSFKLVVLLSGTKAGHRYPVDVSGSVHNGMVTTDPSYRRVKRTTIVGGVATALLAGALAVVLLLNNVQPFTRLPAGLVCVPGGLTISGSSAFGPVVTKAAGSYHAYCPDSVIDVLTPGSLQGLQELHDAPPAVWPTQLALSDGRADPNQFPGVASDAVGIVPYTFVANAKVPVNGLTLDQARAIFTGQVTRWSEITGNPSDTEQIRVIGRTTASGTRSTLEHYVLGTAEAPATSDTCQDRRPQDATAAAVVCETASTDDLVATVAAVAYSIGYADVPVVAATTGVKAISLNGHGSTLTDIFAGYPFWTVEYVYSHGPLKPGTLAASFADYLASPESGSTMSTFHDYACRDANGLCTTGR